MDSERNREGVLLTTKECCLLYCVSKFFCDTPVVDSEPYLSAVHLVSSLEPPRDGVNGI
jgi:hypothetical protein